MAGQSTVSNTFGSVDIPELGFTSSFHFNFNTGGEVPNPEDHQHSVAQVKDVITTSGERVDVFIFFDNGGLDASGPGLNFNVTIHDFQNKETFHFNNHAADTLLDAIQQPQADLTNLQQAAADTVSTHDAHDAGLQPDLHAANVQASAFHLV